MATRYRHVMARTKAGRRPTAIVSVACSYNTVPIPDRKGYDRMTLTQWAATSTILTREDTSSSKNATGTTALDWWQQIDRMAARGGTVLIVSANAPLEWCLLGLWEEMEYGRCWCSETRNAAGDSDGSQLSEMQGQPVGSGCGQELQRSLRLQSVWSGNLVLEDPPAIAHFRRAGHAASFRWVDIRNYGISPDTLPPGDDSISRELNRIMVSMDAELTSRGLGSIKDTSASQSLHSFRHKHLSSCIVCHTVKDVLGMEDSAYYSGRCECYFIGHYQERVHELDMRSAYVWCMLNLDVPVRLVDYQLSPAQGEVPDIDHAARMCADVTIRTNRSAYPCRRENGTIYPIGCFRTTLSGPELAHAAECGHIVKWHGWSIYDCEPALRGYAQEVYDMRRQYDERNMYALSSWAKALAVALVGKCGQRSRLWQWHQEKRPRCMWDQYYQRWTDGRVYRWQEIAGIHRRECVSGWASDSVPAIAAWITAACRQRLWQAIQCAGSAEVVYMDTDSIFVSQAGFNQLMDSGWIRQGECGYFEERGAHDEIDIRGIKSYRTTVRERDAGFPRSARREGDRQDLIRQNVWASTCLARGDRPGGQSKLVHWHRSGAYKHGIVTAGGRVEPIRLNEESTDERSSL